MTSARLGSFVRFNVASALGMGVQLGVLWVLTHEMHVAIAAATATAVAAAVVHNFLWHWRWTWADRARPRAGMPAAFARFALANGAVSLAGNVLVTTALASGTGLPPIAANLAAIGACGLVNFALAERVFARGKTAVVWQKS